MREWIIRLSVAFFSAIIMLVALELVLSKIAPHYKAHPGDILHEPDEIIGWKGIPGKTGKFRFGTIEADIKMNSHGFRDKERPYEKEQNVFRIVVIGDSFIQGLQVPLEETFTQVLEKELNSGSGKRFEVINLAISGFGTDQEYLTLKNYGLSYRPDLVILEVFLGNDVMENSLVLDSQFSGKTKDNRDKPYFILSNGELVKTPFQVKPRGSGEKKETSQRGLKFILVSSFPNIYYTLSDRIRKTPRLDNFLSKYGLTKSSEVQEIPLYLKVYAEEYSPQWQDAWEVTKALILKIVREVEANKMGFLVFVVPNEYEFRPDKWDQILNEYPAMRAGSFDPRKPERILTNFLDANNIDYLLLRPGLEQYSNETGKVLHFHYGWENHWNADGHAAAAGLIYNKLIHDNFELRGGHSVRSNK